MTGLRDRVRDARGDGATFEALVDGQTLWCRRIDVSVLPAKLAAGEISFRLGDRRYMFRRGGPVAEGVVTLVPARFGVRLTVPDGELVVRRRRFRPGVDVPTTAVGAAIVVVVLGLDWITSPGHRFLSSLAVEGRADAVLAPLLKHKS